MRKDVETRRHFQTAYLEFRRFLALAPDLPSSLIYMLLLL